MQSFQKPYSVSGSVAKPVKPKKPKEKRFPGILFIMAIMKMAGTGVTGISGKIAGTVFNSGGQQGPFIRNWAKPRNRRTSSQTFVRGILAGISSSFQALTASQVDAWNQAGQSDASFALRKNVFGDTRKLSGSQLYQRINNILLQIGATVIADPPLVASTDAVTSMACTFAAGTPQADVLVTTFAGATAVPANTSLVVYATPQKSNGRSYFGKSQYRLLAVYPATTAINPLDILADYNTKFGTLVAGSRIGIKAHFVFNDTGLFSKGGDVYATAVVAP
jgi:hypothetical protein